ncbi:MAG: stage II sporulation protein R [Agathobacter sp.]|nr:stage II sporulation protein R [Agathobacter sp.]
MKKYIVYISIAVIAGLIWYGNVQERRVQEGIADKVLRFHVLANSNKEEDQNLKISVRDAVGTYLGPFLQEADSLEDTKIIVSEQMDEVLAICQKTIQEQGFAYAVTGQLVSTDFPKKSYGVYTFPEGEYEALQIVIGSGGGDNWWCVLYPNMCFRGTLYEVVEEDAKEELQEVLSPEEYKGVFDSGKVKLRFKFLEFFQKRG